MKRPTFDARVDDLGKARAAGARAKELGEELKREMRIGQALIGEKFLAVLERPDERSIEPAKLLRLYRAGKLNLEGFLACISVRVGEAEKTLPGTIFRRIVRKHHAAPRLILEAL